MAGELGDVVTLRGTGVLTPQPQEEVAEEAEVVAEETVAEEEETAVSDAEPTDDETTNDDFDEDLVDEEDDEVIFDEVRRDFLLDSQKVFPGTPFVENLVGLSAGEDTEFSFVFPEDYEEESLVGREITFHLSVIEVKDREVPAIDDELAKLNGRFETLDELREGLRKDLHEQAEQQATDDLAEAFIDDLLVDAAMVTHPQPSNWKLMNLLTTSSNKFPEAAGISRILCACRLKPKTTCARAFVNPPTSGSSVV